MGMSHLIAFKAADLGCKASLGVYIRSNSLAEMFQQMRLLLQAQGHLEHENPSSPPLIMSRKCAEVLEMAAMGGAEAVGLQDLIESITPGKRADLLITKCNSTRIALAHDPVGTLPMVPYANGSDIDAVMINGVIVKSRGGLTNVDWPKVREELRASVAAIMVEAKTAPTDDLQAAGDAMVKVLSYRISKKCEDK
jgi:cytosine/adenosine deaminase-related metal-dependent hydrolase